MRMATSGNSILLDDQKLSFYFSNGGKRCYMISARALPIAWGDDSRYWKWYGTPHSRFPKVAQLIQVCSLDISGKINVAMLSSRTRYATYIVFQRASYSYGLDQPAKAKVELVGGGVEASERTVRLGGGEDVRHREDGWLEIELGEFYNREPCFRELVFGVKATTVLNWKRGLIVQGIELRPKGTSFDIDFSF